MGHLIDTVNELCALRELLTVILNKGVVRDSCVECHNILITIPYNKQQWKIFCLFKDTFSDICGETAKKGWKKATRVYTNVQDRHIKPSYLGRLLNYPDRPRNTKDKDYTINQIETIVKEMADKPGYNCLSFVIFRPADLIDKIRPGYVPCPIAGDFKFRNGQLSLSVMFRTNDALSVAFADIYYLRQLQMEVLNKVCQFSNKSIFKDAEIGDLNLYFSRTFINRYVQANGSKKSHGSRIAQKLISAIATYQVTFSD